MQAVLISYFVSHEAYAVHKRSPCGPVSGVSWYCTAG